MTYQLLNVLVNSGLLKEITNNKTNLYSYEVG